MHGHSSLWSRVLSRRLALKCAVGGNAESIDYFINMKYRASVAPVTWTDLDVSSAIRPDGKVMMPNPVALLQHMERTFT
jgi:hypothetical protein